MTTLPTWALYLISLGTPLSAFIGVVVGQVLLRKGATELDIWRRREETMRMLRWACEQATSTDASKARMGLAALDALSVSELLQQGDENLVDTVIDSLIEASVEEIEEVGEIAGAVEVIEIDSTENN